MQGILLAAALSLCTPFLDVSAGLYGYRGCSGEVGLPATFLNAEAFNACGIAAVLDMEGWRYIDRSGRSLVRPMVFDNGPDDFSEGLARYVDGGKYGYFDRCGKVVIPAQYDFALPFEGGKARAGFDCTFPPADAAGEHRGYACKRWIDLRHPDRAELRQTGMEKETAMGLWDRIRQLAGGGIGITPAAAQEGAAAKAGEGRTVDAAFAQSWQARDAFWAGVGRVEKDVLGHLISPGLMGGPQWPTTRQAYRVVRREGSIVIATDGLSDPFDDGREGNGFGMELFVETADILPDHAGRPGDVSRLSESWAFELVSHVAGTVAGAGGISAQLDKYGVLSMELPGVSQSRAIGKQVPARYVTEDDSLGVLIGMPVEGFPVTVEGMPLSTVRVVPVTIITAAELEALRTGGAGARRALAEELARRGNHHRSALR